MRGWGTGRALPWADLREAEGLGRAARWGPEPGLAASALPWGW